MRPFARLAAVLVIAFAPLVAPLIATGPAQAQAERLHGADSVFRSPAVTIGWAVLKGGDEASTIVVLRVLPRTDAYRLVSVDGVDPFTKAHTRFVDGLALTMGVASDIRSPRGGFADAPSRELHFFPDRPALLAGKPAVTVFYLGVPDTTPEFTSEAALDAYLRDATR